MNLIYEQLPDVTFSRDTVIRIDDLSALNGFLQVARDDSPFLYAKDDARSALGGVWVRRGTYRHKHGSFIDPSDLSVYGGQYYEPDPQGRFTAFELNWKQPIPEDAVVLETVADLRRWIDEQLPQSDDAELDFAPEQQLSQTTLDSAPEQQTSQALSESEPSRQSSQAPLPIKFLQPHSAFEYHGKLATTWHAAVYTGNDEAATELIVFC